MLLFIFGLFLFLATVPLYLFPSFKEKVIHKLKKSGYLAILISAKLLSLFLIIYYFKAVPWISLWTPPASARIATHAIMPLAFMLLMLALLPTTLGYLLRKPLALALLFWSGVHLFANGELNTTLLFGTFLIYGFCLLLKGRSKSKSAATNRYYWIDILAIAVGLGLFPLVMFNHFVLFGMPAI